MSPAVTDMEPACANRATVVGAGIAGLSAAIGLRRAGWHVTVLERSRFHNEIGAAISVPPNAAMVLDRWGFDVEKAQGVPNVARRMYHASTLATLSYEDFSSPDDFMSSASWSFHRVDLHRGLRALAACSPRPGEGAVDLRLGVSARAVDCDGGLVTLQDGGEVRASLVVIADGARSRLVDCLAPAPVPLVPTGRSIYRFLVSMADVLADPALAAIYDPARALPGFKSFLEPAHDILWVSYACRGGRTLNNAIVHATQPGEGEGDGDDGDAWHSAVSPARVLALLRDFAEAPRRIVRLASEDGIKAHRLFRRPPLESFVRGRAVVVGDAAHVMMPTHAAAGSIAIETAAALEVLLGGVDGRDGPALQRRLELFDRLRLPRCNLTMLASNAGPAFLAVPGVEEEVRRFYDGPLPPLGALPWSPEFREVLFHHDAFRAAEEALAAEHAGRVEE